MDDRIYFWDFSCFSALVVVVFFASPGTFAQVSVDDILSRKKGSKNERENPNVNWTQWWGSCLHQKLDTRLKMRNHIQIKTESE